MTRSITRCKRALSPVIATVILVSVTIVVAVSVAYWMGGIAGVYTRFEKVEITSIYAIKNSTYYTIYTRLKNSGSQDTTIDRVLVNGKPMDQHGNGTEITSDIPTLGLTITVGQSKDLEIYIEINFFDPGTTLDLKFHSASGKDYPQMISLP